MGEPQLVIAPEVRQPLATSRVASFRDAVMGYNHQVPHRGRVFHVQSEDSGSAKRHIFTHVFFAGTIIASNRIDYGANASTADISDLLKKSQKSMLHRLVRGSLDEKIARCFGRVEASGRPVLEVVPSPEEEPEPKEVSDTREHSALGEKAPSDSAGLEAQNEVLRELAANVSGTLGVAVVDGESGECLGTAGSGIDLVVAAAGSVKVMKAQNDVMCALGQTNTLEDMLITTDTQYHIIRPVNGRMSLYLVIERSQGNLALARHKLGAAAIDPRIDRELS